MLFSQVIPDFLLGKPIRRKCWPLQNNIDKFSNVRLSTKAMTATDWEVVSRKISFTIAFDAFIHDKTIISLESGRIFYKKNAHSFTWQEILGSWEIVEDKSLKFL